MRGVPGERAARLWSEYRILQAVIDNRVRARARARVPEEPLVSPGKCMTQRNLERVVMGLPRIVQTIDGAIINERATRKRDRREAEAAAAGPAQHSGAEIESARQL